MQPAGRIAIPIVKDRGTLQLPCCPNQAVGFDYAQPTDTLAYSLHRPRLFAEQHHDRFNDQLNIVP